MTPEEKRLIGWSDGAAIVGVHPNRRPIDVWRRVVLGEDTPDSPILKRGRLLEPVIREMTKDELGLKLLGPRRLRDVKRPWLRCSLDDEAWAENGGEPVEMKSVSPWAAHHYGDGEDAVPEWHIIQVQGYLYSTGAQRAHLVALIGTDDLRHYLLAADVELQSMVVEAVEKFHRDFVETQKPPPPDSSESYGDYLKARFPESNGELIQPDYAAKSAVERYRAAKAVREQAEEAEKAARNQLVSLLGPAAGFDGLCTYRETKGRASVNWSAVAEEAGVEKALIEKHTTRTPYRVLRLTGSK